MAEHSRTDEPAGVVVETYGQLLERYREARGISQRALAREIGLSHVLINRSEKGERPPAGTDEIAAIARVLHLTQEEHDHLLAAAGFWPGAFVALGPTDPTLRQTAAVLADPAIPDQAREEFRRAVAALAGMAALTRPGA
jgi:transcriptional regulator with XRE-family HTH domain